MVYVPTGMYDVVLTLHIIHTLPLALLWERYYHSILSMNSRESSTYVTRLGNRERESDREKDVRVPINMSPAL